MEWTRTMNAIDWLGASMYMRRVTWTSVKADVLLDVFEGRIERNQDTLLMFERDEVMRYYQELGLPACPIKSAT